MNRLKRSSHQHGAPARESIRHDQGAYWRRAHRDWRVWVGLFFMLSAITIYVLSNDLSFFGQRRHWLPEATGEQRGR